MAATSKPRGWQLADRLWIMGSPKLADVDPLGITAIVRVARQPLDPAVAARVAHDRHIPLPDGKGVHVASTTLAARSVAGFWRQGETVLVTCMAGRNRSALVAALALVHLDLVPPGLVIDHIRRCRPRALANPSAAAWLERWLALAAERSVASAL